MSTYLAQTSPGEPRGYHDIDTDLGTEIIRCLPNGLMHHHAFQPQLWCKGDHVVVESADGDRFEGEAIDVSEATGGVLIQLEFMPPNHGQDVMPDVKMVS